MQDLSFFDQYIHPQSLTVSLPLKKWWERKTSLSFWVSVDFQGLLLLNFAPGCIYIYIYPEEIGGSIRCAYGIILTHVHSCVSAFHPRSTEVFVQVAGWCIEWKSRMVYVQPDAFWGFVVIVAGWWIWICGMCWVPVFNRIEGFSQLLVAV